MLDLYTCLKWAVTSIVLFMTTNWFITSVVFSFKRDLNPLALQEQSHISAVRKEGETAIYRNFTAPHGFPLTTGLNLAIGYRFRNGNFGDVWNAVMELSKSNTVSFTNDSKKYSLKEINGMAKTILKNHLSDGYKQIGIAVPTSTLQGFAVTVASMMGSVKNDIVPHFLSSVPRQKIEGVDVLVVGSWKIFKLLNGSESWYKVIIVCDSSKNKPANLDIQCSVKTWDDIIESYQDDNKFEYTTPNDKSDDNKLFLYVTSPWNETTSFTQMSLVSTLSAFIKSFPLDNEITTDDELTVVGSLSESSSIQIFNKVFGVLLYGASISFVKEYSITSKEQPSLLFINGRDIQKLLNDQEQILNSSLINRIKLSWATTLLSEGIFTKLAQLSPNVSSSSFDRIRCIFIAESISDVQLVSSYNGLIPEMKQRPKRTLITFKLNIVRAIFGSRAILELYSPYIAIGPIAATNFYDYRVLPGSVDTNVTLHGTLSSTLEGKFVNTESNPKLDVASRQGMLCIRGFCIGKPVEEERLKKAIVLGETFGGEGWMPLVGIFGLWGHDGCLYVYN